MIIITDGEIMDMNDTVSEIVKLSGMPCSIIIIGVGEETFEKMHTLEGDV